MPAPAAKPRERGTAAFDPPSGAPVVASATARRFTWRTLLFLTAIGAVFVAAFSMTAVYARTGYFVGFEGADVVVFKGHPGGVLWFEPTVEVRTGKRLEQLTTSDATELAGQIEFSSLTAAVNYVKGLETTPDTTVTTAPETTVSATPETTGTGPGAGTTVPTATIPSATVPTATISTVAASSTAAG